MNGLFRIRNYDRINDDSNWWHFSNHTHGILLGDSSSIGNYIQNKRREQSSPWMDAPKSRRNNVLQRHSEEMRNLRSRANTRPPSGVEQANSDLRVYPTGGRPAGEVAYSGWLYRIWPCSRLVINLFIDNSRHWWGGGATPHLESSPQPCVGIEPLVALFFLNLSEQPLSYKSFYW